MTSTPVRSYAPCLDQLADILDDVVYEQAGQEVFACFRRLRQLARERRCGMPEAEERLMEALHTLDHDVAADITRAYTLYFDLANLAEELNRIRTLQRRTAAVDGPGGQNESVFEAIRTLKERGCSATDVQRIVHLLRIEPVFTAHPSEAKRRTTRAVLRRLRNELARTPTDSTSEMPTEIRRAIRAGLIALWQSDLLRPARPNVQSEIERGLFFASTLWTVVPQIKDSLRTALAVCYPDVHFDLPPLFRFGTWIGGDRDGHPFVTTDVTRTALDMMRDTAIAGYLDQCQSLMGVLVMSSRHTAGLQRLQTAIDEVVSGRPELQESLSDVSESELGRRWLRIIEQRLQATQAGTPENAYKSAADLEHDVQLLADVLSDCRCSELVQLYVQPWLDNVQTFGLSLAAMDIRQHSRVHEAAVAELMARNDVCADYSALSDDERSALLIRTLDQHLRLDADGASEDLAELVDLLRLLAQRMREFGADSFGGYVVSMTHSASDILCVLWLWTHVWRDLCESDEPLFLPIAPLFETIEDLEQSTGIMESLWSIPVYREYLQSAADNSQLVMIGYSDSTKDGGYLTASWKLHQAQTKLAAIAEDHGLRLVVFHGRGGALGRGGGPAARAVLSLPPAAVGGAMRVTEQGEILAERYDNPEIARRHLEQVTWATLLVTAEDSFEVPAEYSRITSEMAETSFRHYRQLVSHDAFLTYFQMGTPISEIETLPIGSRPSRRTGRRSLADLRAIPWTFAWTQSRSMIPAWYGLGTALRQFVDKPANSWSVLRDMYRSWRFFAAVIDNAELALAKTDIDIARQYSRLSDSTAQQQIWPMIEEEFRRCRAGILLLKQQDELLEDTRWLQQSILDRNPGVDPLNLLQIRLLAESRAEDADDAEVELSHLLRLTINGIAAGLRTTG